uniref:Terpene synthase metal-binding domain-containing protein n=1 Tax=Lactuca sativa TaxID=4236 RepID=A0A9R1XXE2_LACSA|nr:hypothetical protein LSAT_V11C100005730 [Lactuca sativa]
MKKYIRSYMTEAKRTHKGNIPIIEKHIKMTYINSGYKFTLAASFIAMGDEEQERKHVASGIECYMKQFDVTKQHVYVEDACKESNKESLIHKDVKMPIIMRVISLACLMDVLYKNKDHFTHVGEELINHINSLVVDATNT